MSTAMIILRRMCVQLEVNLVQSNADCIFKMALIFDIFFLNILMCIVHFINLPNFEF